MKLKNKKGDVPVTILVIGVFAVCSLALLTFFVSDFKVSNSFVGLDVMHKMNSQLDEYNFYLNQGGKYTNVNEFFDFTFEDGKKYLYFEKERGGKILFSVKYNFP